MSEVRVTHPDKILFPRDGFTKADMIRYYEDVASVMLPHMRGHPIAMLRFNQGIDGERFFHKQAPSYFPHFIDRVEVPKAKGTTTYPVCNNTGALLYIANHNCVEFHLLGPRANDLRRPDRIVFDLDPSVEDFDEVRRSALSLRDLLDEIGLSSFVMTSGSRGLHVWVPLDRRSFTDRVLEFSAEVARVLVSRSPDTLTTEFSKADRAQKIYVDVARNAPAQHAIAPYSLRAKDGAPVATPLDWDEVNDPGLGPQSYTLSNMRERLDRTGDPWKGVSRRARSLARAWSRLQRLAAA